MQLFLNLILPHAPPPATNFYFDLRIAAIKAFTTQENMTLIKALAHRNKSFDLSGVEFQKLRINLRNVQEKNLQLAQANSHTLDELSTNRDRACFSGIEVAQNEAFLFHYIAASMTN
ncbi:unnamed protein product [Brassica napus]|uniref:(rape) hypothetical protein n=1 Tax=Brassica napus TaxID=3708 RepID=A0A816XA98_BRANA|nr:unnamed protein product [Brassica napus]